MPVGFPFLRMALRVKPTGLAKEEKRATRPISEARAVSSSSMASGDERQRGSRYAAQTPRRVALT